MVIIFITCKHLIAVTTKPVFLLDTMVLEIAKDEDKEQLVVRANGTIPSRES